MSLFKRTVSRRLAPLCLLCAALVLSACGYRPLFGQNNVSTQTLTNLASIRVTSIADRVGQMLHSALTHRLSPKAHQAQQRFTLHVTLNESLATLAVERDASATRTNLTLTAYYKLIRSGDGKPMTSGSVRTVSSYNILASDFATLTAQNDSRSRAVEDLAETLRLRLAIYFQGPGLVAPQSPVGQTRRVQP